jgi:queuine tRNA-ribosyltransferase
LIKTSRDTGARLGKLITAHGDIETPVFMPVGSQGSVKTLVPEEIIATGTQIVLSNTYHLYLRPGVELIEKLGGLHSFIGWNRPILTDSGGYQIFSLSNFCKIDDDGVLFRSHIDGSEHRFTPELVVSLQERLGSDIIMVLDHCPDFNDSREKVVQATSRTHMWARRCKDAHNDERNLLFSIIQGGMIPELRRESAGVLVDMDFPGYAIGGLSLGEPKEITWNMVDTISDILPRTKPRYLMGMGSPEDILEGVGKGIDMFDSALPTRVARNGALFTGKGRINIRKSVYSTRKGPVDDECDCYTCRNFSTAYVHHLFKCEELLAYRLATIHNVRFIIKLMEDIKASIANDTFAGFKVDFLAHYEATNESERIAQKEKWLQSRARSREID